MNPGRPSSQAGVAGVDHVGPVASAEETAEHAEGRAHRPEPLLQRSRTSRGHRRVDRRRRDRQRSSRTRRWTPTRPRARSSRGRSASSSAGLTSTPTSTTSCAPAHRSLAGLDRFDPGRPVAALLKTFLAVFGIDPTRPIWVPTAWWLGRPSTGWWPSPRAMNREQLAAPPRRPVDLMRRKCRASRGIVVADDDPLLIFAEGFGLSATQRAHTPAHRRSGHACA